jgi:AcrR family transcriptional regulator
MPSDDSGLQSGYANGGPELLELRTSPPQERADAARNRAAVLSAAADLFRRQGVGNVSMDTIAAAAGVGKGTLFRRFGDKAGLAVALLDERERELQERILHGPAPLGPGGADDPPTRPRERLIAFVDAYLDYVLAHLDLVRMSETASPGARYRIGAYRFWHRHVAILIAGAATTKDPEAIAHALLASLAAEHLHAVMGEQGADRVRDATLALVTAIR